MARKEGMKPIHILVTEENRELISAHAGQRGFKVTADYIRLLIQEDMKAHGAEIDLGVDRGGYRERGATE